MKFAFLPWLRDQWWKMIRFLFGDMSSTSLFRGAILVHEEPTGGLESLDTSKKQEALTTNEV